MRQVHNLQFGGSAAQLCGCAPWAAITLSSSSIKQKAKSFISVCPDGARQIYLRLPVIIPILRSIFKCFYSRSVNLFPLSFGPSCRRLFHCHFPSPRGRRVSTV